MTLTSFIYRVVQVFFSVATKVLAKKGKYPRNATKDMFEILWEYLSVLLFFLAECEALVHLKERKMDSTKKGVSEAVHHRITKKRKWERRKGRRKEKHL